MSTPDDGSRDARTGAPTGQDATSGPGPAPGPAHGPASGTPPAPARRPASVYGVGTEPDARFSLANERTALAWLRTALGLVAGGVGLASLASLTDPHVVVVDVVAALACATGGLVALYALRRWRATERALRLGRPLPVPGALPTLVAGVVLLGLLLAAFALGRAV